MQLPSMRERFDPRAHAETQNILMQADNQNLKRGRNAEIENLLMTGNITLGIQSLPDEGGQITMTGAGANATWDFDNFQGRLRWFTAGFANMQLLSSGQLLIASQSGGSVVGSYGITSARVEFSEGEQAADEKLWDILVDAKQMSIRTVNDAGSAANNFLTFFRGAGIALQQINCNTHFYFAPNNTFDIGTAGAYPRNIQYGTSITRQGAQMLGNQITGWGTPTNTVSRGAFDTAAVTLPQLAQRVGQLIIDCMAQGFIHT